MQDHARSQSPRPAKGKRWALTILFLFNIVLFSSLGTWQVQRLAWKKDLIARVDARVHQAPVPAPTQAQWAGLTPENAEYQRVQLQGRLLPDQEVTVYASTDLGPGYWVMVPMRVEGGAADAVVWINLGYVPNELRRPDNRPGQTPAEPVQITGLLRFPEQDNLFLRDNVPAEDRWYRRDPGEFSAARTLPPAHLAPYFVDAQANGPQDEGQWPRAGMTQIQFRNNHLSYAITWFVLALLNVAALVFLYTVDRHRRLRQLVRDDD